MDIVVGTGTGLSISSRGGGLSGARVDDIGGAGRVVDASRAVVAGRVVAEGRTTRLGLRDLLCLTVVVDSPLVALRNTAVRSFHPPPPCRRPTVLGPAVAVVTVEKLSNT